jgi:hypothetical protein
MPPTPELPESFIWGHRCLATDPGPWIDYLIDEGDPGVRTQLVVLRLETVAKVYGVLAESAAQAARIQAQGGGE